MDKHTKESIDSSAGAGTSDKIDGNVREGKGRIEKAAGELTGDKKLKREGVKDEIAGKTKKAIGEVKAGAEHLLDKAKEGLHKH